MTPFVLSGLIARIPVTVNGSCCSKPGYQARVSAPLRGPRTGKLTVRNSVLAKTAKREAGNIIEQAQCQTAKRQNGETENGRSGRDNHAKIGRSNDGKDESDTRRGAGGTQQADTRRREEMRNTYNMRICLGWLRLDWLKIPLVSLNYLNVPLNN